MGKFVVFNDCAERNLCTCDRNKLKFKNFLIYHKILLLKKNFWNHKLCFLFEFREFFYDKNFSKVINLLLKRYINVDNTHAIKTVATVHRNHKIET